MASAATTTMVGVSGQRVQWRHSHTPCVALDSLPTALTVPLGLPFDGSSDDRVDT
jgi:hypothetical protein